MLDCQILRNNIYSLLNDNRINKTFCISYLKILLLEVGKVSENMFLGQQKMSYVYYSFFVKNAPKTDFTCRKQLPLKSDTNF